MTMEVMNGKRLCCGLGGAEWAGLEGAPSAQGLRLFLSPDCRGTGRSYSEENKSRGMWSKQFATEE